MADNTEDLKPSTPVADILSHAKDEPLAEVSPVSSTWHHPGAALETEADRDAQVDDLQLREGDAPEPVEYDGIDTRDPELNLASRSNIVEPVTPPNPDVVAEFATRRTDAGNEPSEG